MNAKSVVGGLALGLLAMTLTACDPVVNMNADVAMALLDGQVRFVSCEPLDIVTVVSELRDFGDPDSEWVTILDADGSASIPAGDSFGPDLLPVGLRASIVSAEAPGPGVTVSLFAVSAPPGANLRTNFVVPEDGIPSSRWLRPDGEIRDEPCGA